MASEIEKQFASIDAGNKWDIEFMVSEANLPLPVGSFPPHPPNLSPPYRVWWQPSLISTNGLEFVSIKERRGRRRRSRQSESQSVTDYLEITMQALYSNCKLCATLELEAALRPGVPRQAALAGGIQDTGQPEKQPIPGRQSLRSFPNRPEPQCSYRHGLY